MCVDVLISDLYVPQGSKVLTLYHQYTFSGVSMVLSNVHGQSANQYSMTYSLAKALMHLITLNCKTDCSL